MIKFRARSWYSDNSRENNNLEPRTAAGRDIAASNHVSQHSELETC